MGAVLEWPAQARWRGACPMGTGEPLELYREGMGRLFSCRKLPPAE